MQWMYSLRTRLIVLYAGLIVLGLVALAYWSAQQIVAAVEEDFARQTEDEVSLVAQALVTPLQRLSSGDLSQQDIQVLLEGYAQKTESELSLLKPNGEVWFQSEGAASINSQLDTPELTFALQDLISHEVRHNPAGDMAVFTAAAIEDEGQTVALVQLIAPLDGVQGTLDDRLGTLAIGFVLLGSAMFGVSVLISTSLTSPLSELKVAAQKFSGGHFAVEVSATSRDEIGQIAQALHEMSNRMQRMLDDHRASVGNTAHELRTPLMSIQMRVEALLAGNTTPDKHQQYLNEVHSEVLRLRNLVSDLLLLSRFEAGSVTLGQDQVDLPRFARRMVREFTEIVEEKSISLSLETDDALPPVSANLTHLHVVFRNIIDNAIKYMEGDIRHIHWRIARQDNIIVNTITDTGRGIAADDLAAVLKRFYRADKSHSRTIQGTGLGLSLVQSIIDAYGGDLNIVSEGRGKGTTVTITWATIEKEGLGEFPRLAP